jgi:hypothetical protein
MLTFIQKCGATSETAEDLRDFIMNAKKSSNLHFEDFKQRLEELDDYLPYLQDLSINVWEMINFS